MNDPQINVTEVNANEFTHGQFLQGLGGRSIVRLIRFWANHRI